MADTDCSADICAQVLQARSEQSRLGIRGASSKPWRCADPDSETLSLAAHRGVVSHDSAELVVTVRAGTPLAELDAIVAQQGQMLAAECPDFPGGSTIGGALALGWSGSRQPWSGSLRDFVLGCRMVNGLGEPLRFGGQVIKNVAGYDISRLLSGSLGRLGVILEVSLKLLPLPQREMTLQFEFDCLGDSRQFVQGLQQAGEPLTGASYHAGLLHLRISGQNATVTRLAANLGGKETDDDYWRNLRCLQLPFFTDALPGESLYDWNGELCWSHSQEGIPGRQVGNAAIVDLNTGPVNPVDEPQPLAELQRRVARAFDPDGIFQPAPVGDS